ncbi:hypothetical protein BT67DRAFT_219808 [Trichocladium antarcticum]|uniref:Uncharacterized protein n=1 Tax=Trichocladium antarcticum TaxID=1450529 RepID=A0AAN6Z966_9PEZI|nr:hypothetical protein BT67DRAFT_219808 [Trichocladium antarcticum]
MSQGLHNWRAIAAGCRREECADGELAEYRARQRDSYYYICTVFRGMGYEGGVSPTSSSCVCWLADTPFLKPVPLISTHRQDDGGPAVEQAWQSRQRGGLLGDDQVSCHLDPNLRAQASSTCLCHRQSFRSHDRFTSRTRDINIPFDRAFAFLPWAATQPQHKYPYTLAVREACRRER